MTALEHNTSTPTTDIDIVDTAPSTSMVVAGNTPQEILQNAAAIAAPLADLIEKQGLYQKMGVDKKTGKERRHVNVEGWQAAGAMLGAMGGTPIHAQTTWARRMQCDDDVIAYEAHVEIRTIHGDTVGAAEAMCSNAEQYKTHDDEYSLRSMAETRAESRAYRKAIGWIISLAGFSPTPAEEMGAQTVNGSGGEPVRTELPAWAAPVSDVSGVAQSLVNLFQAAGVDKPDEHAMRIGEAVFQDCSSTIPVGVWQAINHIARELQGTWPTADGRVADAMAEGFDEAAAEDAARAAPVDAEATSDTDMTQHTHEG